MHARRTALLLVATALAGCTASRSPLAAVLEYQLATTVLLGREAGDARDVVTRWQQPVRYLAADLDPRQRSVVDGAIVQIRAALAGAHEVAVEHVRASDPRLGLEGYVSIWFVAPARAGGLAAAHGLDQPDDTADGWFSIEWNDYFELERAFVFVDPDLDDAWLRHTVLEELFQVLGIANDSPLVADSVVFEGASVAGSHTELSSRDRQLLRLLYRDLVPGATAGDVAAAMERSWRF
jgi:hypothetical protein